MRESLVLHFKKSFASWPHTLLLLTKCYLLSFFLSVRGSLVGKEKKNDILLAISVQHLVRVSATAR